jgi:hypothetical protein
LIAEIIDRQGEIAHIALSCVMFFTTFVRTLPTILEVGGFEAS